MSVEAPRMSGSDLEADFTAFFEAEYERLLQALYLMSGSRADAEDLAQGDCCIG